MTVSFVVIAYNEAQNITATIRAIAGQQDMPDHEIIVVNDGSRDDTLAIVQALAREYPTLRIVDLQPNRGRGAARAAGVAAATGKYIAFVDADILLPPDWLSRCMPTMATHDACGGTAVPDGDAAWVHRIFRLRPKVAPHSTTVTGSNGLFHRQVFDQVAFDPQKKDGEDVALGHGLAAAGLRTATVPGLLVTHCEAKSFGVSIAWLFVSGIGASRQLYEYKQVRLPDIAFIGFLGAVVGSAIALVIGVMPVVTGLTVLGYALASSVLHMHGKFVLAATPVRSVGAVLVNGAMLVAYYSGRAVGLVTQWRQLWLVRSPS